MPEPGEAALLERYRRLIDIARDLASTLELDPLLSRIIFAARDISEAGAASILLYDAATKQLYFQVATNLNAPALRGVAIPQEESIAGWVVENRRPLRVGHVTEDQRFFSAIAEITGYPTDSLIAVPLIAKDKVVGALEVLNKKSGEFSQADEDLLTVLAAQAAVAIENSRLFQQSDLISEFVHELRTPLASLATSAYLLMRPEMSPGQSNRILEGLHEESLRLNALASAFLDLARLESGRVRYDKGEFDLRVLFEDCAALFQAKAAETGVQIEILAPQGELVVYADRDRLKQVLINLISNSVKYNRRMGRVSLSAEEAEGQVVLRVSDTGIGIPARALPHLFEKFYRVRGSDSVTGTGLGLPIARQIVLSHGGQIEVTSKYRRGTTFTICLPQ